MAQYKVEFLPANISVSAGRTDETANLIETRINAWASQGWELDQVAQISVAEKPGCLAAILGAKETSIEYNCLVFRR